MQEWSETEVFLFVEILVGNDRWMSLHFKELQR